MSMSLMELGRRIHENEISLEDALREMKSGSRSVLLSWSEDDGELWECSWIVGGVRYTAHHFQPRTAVLGAVVECTKHFAATVPHVEAGQWSAPTIGDEFPDDFVTTGWAKVNGQWYELGSTPGVTTDPPAGPPEVAIHDVAAKLNELERVTIERLSLMRRQTMWECAEIVEGFILTREEPNYDLVVIRDVILHKSSIEETAA